MHHLFTLSRHRICTDLQNTKKTEFFLNHLTQPIKDTFPIDLVRISGTNPNTTGDDSEW